MNGYAINQPFSKDACPLICHVHSADQGRFVGSEHGEHTRAYAVAKEAYRRRSRCIGRVSGNHQISFIPSEPVCDNWDRGHLRFQLYLHRHPTEASSGELLDMGYYWSGEEMELAACTSRRHQLLVAEPQKSHRDCA